MRESAVSYPFADLSLARRLERAKAEGCARFVEARSRLVLDSGAAWIDVAGTYAMFDGPSSPLTQTFGFGLFPPPAAENRIELERFFRHRGAPVSAARSATPSATDSASPTRERSGACSRGAQRAQRE